MSAKKQSKEPSFEQELERLETLAETMEGGELTLSELLAAYEEGAQLAKTLGERLNAARARLSEVGKAKDGSLTVTPSDIVAQDELPDESDG
jgi:exodeoxyribonuclease VII small subunit